MALRVGGGEVWEGQGRLAGEEVFQYSLSIVSHYKEFPGFLSN